jgi:hypothetical protein
MTHTAVAVALIALALGCADRAGAQSPQSTYAGEQQRAIKALSADEQRGWLEGQGMGLARAAELNSHPGPMHALELAEALALSDRQRRDLQALMSRHKAEARALGAEVVRLEAELDRLFAERRATADNVSQASAAIGAAQARVRASHLSTHVATAALLTPEQIRRYDELRGYTGGSAAPAAAGAPAAETHRHRHRH